MLDGRITFSKTKTAVKKRQLALVKSLQPTSFVTRKKKETDLRVIRGNTELKGLG